MICHAFSKTSFLLALVHAFSNRCLLLTLFLAGGCVGSAQTPQFEVASIRPADPDSRGMMGPRPNGFSGTSIPLLQYVAWAYDIRAELVVAPAWMNSSRFDINAKASGQPTLADLRTMLSGLIEDRFRLSTHWEDRSRSATTLVMAKGGPRTLESAAPGTAQSIYPWPPTPEGTQHWTIEGCTMSGLAVLLGRIAKMDYPILDSTGLSGSYNFSLDLPVKGPDVNASDYQMTSLFPAVSRQLGIDVASKRVSMRMLVVDHAEKNPSQN